MPKKILEDIKPISRQPRKSASTPVPVHVVQSLPREVPFEPQESRGSSRYGLWYVAVALVVVFLFSLSFLFEKAAITLTPKSAAVAFDSSDAFLAQKDSNADDTIVFTEMTLSGDQSMKLPSTSSKEETVPASGRVILYNTYSTTAYKLVKSTRLATPTGTVYRLNNAVTIPGYTKSGSTIVPGSVEATVTADVAGSASNIENGDFTLPGLAGTAQATKIYGRTKTPIAGGISGKVYSVSQDAANAALGTLKTKLKASLIAKAQAQIPDGYLLFEGATLFTSDDTVQAPYSTEEEVPLALHGTLTAYLIKEETLVSAIAGRFVSQYDGEPVTVTGLDSLVLVAQSRMDPGIDITFPFALSGSAKVVWTVEPDEIRALFAGHKKSEFNALLGTVSAIDRAQVVLKPFWKRSFPTDQNRIDVSITAP